MFYCKNCVMPSTRPGISFDERGICSACQSYERRKTIDWKAREKELAELCDKYRNNNNKYDCIIAVSGGKDSHYQVGTMKNEMGMHPLLVSVEDGFPMTKAGEHNIHNISEEFGCDIISLKPNIKAEKKISRYMFEQYGKVTWYIDRLIYVYPLIMAIKFGIPLVVYGENVSYEYGGANYEETYSAREQLKNGVAMDISDTELIEKAGVSKTDLILTQAPSVEEIEKLEPIYLSYFRPWNSVSNYHYAIKHGFHDLTQEWERKHCFQQFDQIDNRVDEVDTWLKYPKFGHADATDYASRYIRYGLITRDEAVDLVRKHDHNLDPLAIRDFCGFFGYTETEFWEIIEKHYNKELFEKDGIGRWVLKKPLWNK